MSGALCRELAGRAQRAQPQEAGKERRRCPFCPCFPVFARVSGRPRRAALRGPFRLPVKPSQPSANLGGTAAAGETGAPQQPGVQLTVLPQPFASPRPFPAHFLRGGRGTALHPCPRRLGTHGRSRPGGAGAARPWSHTHSHLPASCSLSHSTAGSLLPRATSAQPGLPGSVS